MKSGKQCLGRTFVFLPLALDKEQLKLHLLANIGLLDIVHLEIRWHLLLLIPVEEYTNSGSFSLTYRFQL
jgi:hypothetical protein